MKNLLLTCVVVTILSACKLETNVTVKKEKETTEISFITADSIKIYGNLYGDDLSASTILLFHQGGSNAEGEYSSIIPILRKQGFNVLATDQRTGGQRYGSYNKTMSNFHTEAFSYCDAYPDLEAALEFIIDKGFTGKKIIWGSSYSASLVIQLANNHPKDVNAVLAFSPAAGGPMVNCNPNKYFKSLQVPLLVLRPSSEMEYESSQTQLDSAKHYLHETYVAKNGVHGSSMLVDERVEGNAGKTWTVVNDFLSKFK